MVDTSRDVSESGCPITLSTHCRNYGSPEQLRDAAKIVARGYFELAPGGLSRAHLYERPFDTLVGIFLAAVGELDWLHSAAQASDPQQTVIDAFHDGTVDRLAETVTPPESVGYPGRSANTTK